MENNLIPKELNIEELRSHKFRRSVLNQIIKLIKADSIKFSNIEKSDRYYLSLLINLLSSVTSTDSVEEKEEAELLELALNSQYENIKKFSIQWDNIYTKFYTLVDREDYDEAFEYKPVKKEFQSAYIAYLIELHTYLNNVKTYIREKDSIQLEQRMEQLAKNMEYEQGFLNYQKDMYEE